jgi:hypothetical protein
MRLDSRQEMNMHRFQTGLVLLDYEAGLARPVRGCGWSVTYEPKLPAHYHGPKDSLQAILHARTISAAKNAFDLLGAGITLRHGQFVIETDEFPMPEENVIKEALLKRYDEMMLRKICISCDSIAEGISIAAKSSRSIDTQYGLLKYRQGCLSYSASNVDLDPERATEHLGVERYRISHVILAQAIITYYSVIEQLGLEVRATLKKPSRLPSGEWNPPVLEDLTKRLTAAGVRLKSSCVWIQRGTPTKVGTKALSTARVTKTPWTRGPYVRDKFVDVRDAILAASNLRSKVSSHRLDSKVASLTPYDVENVRNLARRLLLTRLGCPIYEAFDE